MVRVLGIEFGKRRRKEDITKKNGYFETPPYMANPKGLLYCRYENYSLRGEYLDRRFFDEEGRANNYLKGITDEIRNLSAEFLGTEEVELFVVGGVVSQDSKIGYLGDLDFFITSTGANPYVNFDRVIFRVTVGDEIENNPANQIATRYNGEFMNAKKGRPEYGRYVDIMLSTCYPYEYYAQSDQEIHYFYDVNDGSWVSVRPKEGDSV